jgi:hypothetical protein
VSCVNNSKWFTANSRSGKPEGALREELLVQCTKKAIFGVPGGILRNVTLTNLGIILPVPSSQAFHCKDLAPSVSQSGKNGHTKHHNQMGVGGETES